MSPKKKRAGGNAVAGPKAGKAPHADAGFIAFLLDQLDEPGVHARAMFGGHGLYRGERFFGIVYRACLYLKVDDASRPEFERRGMGPFRPGPGTTMRGYFEVPPDVLDDALELRRWTERAARVE
jgi:DNA transformation protein